MSNPITFMCQAEVFNGSQCAKQCRACRPTKHICNVADELVKTGQRGKAKRLRSAVTKLRITPDWFKSYRVDVGKDGRYGIYTRDFNCRLATFNANTSALQSRLRLLFDQCNAPPEPKKRKRKRTPNRPDGAAWGPGSGNW